MGAARRKTGNRAISGSISRRISADQSRSNLNEPERLKNSGASVTPRTDLNPKPNLPISSVPRLGDMWENKSEVAPSLSIGSPSSAQ